MNFFNTILILAAAFLAVFAEAAFQLPRHLFGAQVDLLPALMIYAALNTNIATVSLLAALGGLWFDALSANPLGVSILPLFAVGFPICLRRDLILRELPFAQVFLGAAASAAVPALMRFAAVERRPGAVAGLGFALAMAGDDCRRRGGDAGHFRPVRLVPARARLPAANRNQFPSRPRNPAGKTMNSTQRRKVDKDAKKSKFLCALRVFAPLR